MSTCIRGHKLKSGDAVIVLSMGKQRPGIFRCANGKLFDVEVEQHGKPHLVTVSESKVLFADEAEDYDEHLLRTLEQVANRYFD